MKKIQNIALYILITLIAIFVLQIFYTGHLQKANFYLKKEAQKIQVIEKTVIGYTNCPECPPCFSMSDIQAQ